MLDFKYFDMTSTNTIDYGTVFEKSRTTEIDCFSLLVGWLLKLRDWRDPILLMSESRGFRKTMDLMHAT